MKKMAFLWRRRSSLVKIVILLSAVWFTIAFLIYTEDRRGSGTTGQSNNLPLSLRRVGGVGPGGLDDDDDVDGGKLNENDLGNLNGLESVLNGAINDDVIGGGDTGGSFGSDGHNIKTSRIHKHNDKSKNRVGGGGAAAAAAGNGDDGKSYVDVTFYFVIFIERRFFFYILRL